MLDHNMAIQNSFNPKSEKLQASVPAQECIGLIKRKTYTFAYSGRSYIRPAWTCANMVGKQVKVVPATDNMEILTK